MMPVSGVRMVPRQLMGASFVVFSRLAVVFGRALVVYCGLLVMLCAFMLCHLILLKSVRDMYYAALMSRS
jgi:hypothetical protein